MSQDQNISRQLKTLNLYLLYFAVTSGDLWTIECICIDMQQKKTTGLWLPFVLKMKKIPVYARKNFFLGNPPFLSIVFHLKNYQQNTTKVKGLLEYSALLNKHGDQINV